MLVDSWVTVLFGVIRAIGKQGVFVLLNFICYYIIVLPGSYFLSFKFGSHQLPTHDDKIIGLGVNGMWLSFVIGILCLGICQIFIIFICTDWNQIAEKAVERMNSENLVEEEDELVIDVP